MKGIILVVKKQSWMYFTLEIKMIKDYGEAL